MSIIGMALFFGLLVAFLTKLWLLGLIVGVAVFAVMFFLAHQIRLEKVNHSPRSELSIASEFWQTLRVIDHFGEEQQKE